MTILPMRPEHWPEVAAIYAEGIATGLATFETDEAGVWRIQAGVFPENVASMALHAACGFRVVGVRERLGRRDGIWRDVVLLERRSPLI